MRPDDRDRIVAAFSKLDANTIYTRFFSHRKEIPAATLDRIAAIDFVNLAGLVATIGAGADETVIASATYVGIPAADGVKAAEVAFTVEEDYQRQGLASKLLAALATLARRHGIVRFEADGVGRQHGDARRCSSAAGCRCADETRRRRQRSDITLRPRSAGVTRRLTAQIAMRSRTRSVAMLAPVPRAITSPRSITRY